MEQKKRELSEQQKKMISALFGEAEGNWREAMRIAGYSEWTTVREVMEGVREEVLENCNAALASMAPKAISKYNKVLDDPSTPGAPNLLRVVDSVLNRVGLSEKKAGEDVNLKVPSGGLFILPAKEVQEFKKVSEEDTEDAS